MNNILNIESDEIDDTTKGALEFSCKDKAQNI